MGQVMVSYLGYCLYLPIVAGQGGHLGGSPMASLWHPRVIAVTYFWTIGHFRGTLSKQFSRNFSA